ncbi:substrate-binding periplasmic protein [Kiloniella majae]|uniref:substrate-binding periplasmic protein n=1 Tax=Kiloniella majae TaxID=1938558 RepID=UPI000A277187|nr:transporter substrate-binding domain-containing protein [Kiloniella majae]
MRNRSNFFQHLLFILIAQLIVVSAAIAEQEKIIIHAVDYPPYSIEKPTKNNLRGFDVEVVIEAFRRAGINAQVEFMPWPRIMMRTEQGKTAAALSCAKNPNRDHFIYYSDPISNSTSSYIATQNYDGDIPRTLLDGIGKKIVVSVGYVNELELKEAKIPYHSAVNDIAALNILLKRNFDFFYSTKEYLRYITSGQKIASEIKYFDLKKLPFHLCFSKKWPPSKVMISKFNKGLAEIKAEGTYDKIHAKYQ